MKKITTLIIATIVIFNFGFSQDYTTFLTELNKIKSDYKEIHNQTQNIKEFDNKSKEIENDIRELKNSIGDRRNETHQIKALYKEIVEYESFVSQNHSCACLGSYNKFISELYGSTSIIKEQNKVRILKASYSTPQN